MWATAIADGKRDRGLGGASNNTSHKLHSRTASQVTIGLVQQKPWPAALRRRWRFG